MELGSTSLSTSACNGVDRTSTLQAKHKVFLSHSGAQKGFVEQLCVDLERCDRPPFFDKRRDCLPIGEDFPKLIFEAIEQCEVGVVVLSEEFFTSKWPMLELVAMMNVKKRKSSFTIMPILLGLSLSQCRDVDNHKRWLSLWWSWAKCDRRIDLTDWINALELVGPTNALKYNFELGEVKYREEIVEAICRLVPPGTQFEDSHIQGRSRLCKVIHERIKQSKVSSVDGVHVIGVHGFGGIGKSTLCKAMCNDLSKEYRGKVAHMELGSQNEEDLLKELLRRLTDMNLERLGAMTVDEYRNRLKRDMRNVKVFLTIDNVSSATRLQALTLLRANYGHGSLVLVTAHSLSELTSLGILANECMEMPELEMEEARSLFLYHAICVPSTYLSNKDDDELVSACVQRCYFKKGDGISHHYHPLALQTLGNQLSSIGYVRDQWRLQLHKIDFLNPFGEPQHPVFSILRRSFEVLNSQDQLLFMDVALFAPYAQFKFQLQIPTKWSVFEWFGMVHGIPVTSVTERLENLKRKSLLENVGNGFDKIGMHDLWREFARLETKVGDFEKRRWMFEWDEYNMLEEARVTNDSPLVNVRRMFFLEKGFVKLRDVRFFCFPGVTVLKLNPQFGSLQQLDLSGLKDLKSLELDYIYEWRAQPKPLISLFGLGSLLKLVFLRLSNIPSGSPCIDEISRLTNLQVLDLYKGDQVPDLSNHLLLQVACFRFMDSVATIVGFSSNHTQLQFLDLSDCRDLQSCPGVGELFALQELRLCGCHKLIEVPNLQKLKQLRKLDVSSCPLLRGLLGLGDLISLVDLFAYGCLGLVKLPNMRNLRNLRILNVRSCKLISSLPGLNELVCLRSLYMSECDNLTQLPDMHKLTNLQDLKFNRKLPLQSFAGLSDLISLRSLDVGVAEVHDGSDLRKLTMLTSLIIAGLQGQQFSSLAKLVLLESVAVFDCKGVRVLPDLQKLSRLNWLELDGGDYEDMSGLSHLTSLETLTIRDCDKLEALPDLGELVGLEVLIIQHCAQLRDVRGILGLRNLQRLRSSGDLCLHENVGLDRPRPMILRVLLECCRRFANQQAFAVRSQLRELWCTACPIQELPDLAYFPKLSYLSVRYCKNFTNLICTGPLSPALKHLDVFGCENLRNLPDLTNSQEMEFLDVSYSGVVLSAELIQDTLSPALEHLDVSGCESLRNLPDLTKSREMKFLDVSYSGVVLSAELIQDMKARWPSMELIMEDIDDDDDDDMVMTTEDNDDIDLITEDTDEDDDIDLITEDTDEDDDIDLITKDTDEDDDIDLITEDIDKDDDIDLITKDIDEDNDDDIHTLKTGCLFGLVCHG